MCHGVLHSILFSVHKLLLQRKEEDHGSLHKQLQSLSKEGKKQRSETWTGAKLDQRLCLHTGVSSLISSQKPGTVSAPILFPRTRCVYAFEPTNLSLA